jgi:tRNA dimethylallyltransferase
MTSPFLVVIGPTGSGKSALGLELAIRFEGEIVNCDSIQLYRGLDIGSAKTPAQDRRGIPHHLLDVIGPGQELSAGSYARLAREIITGITGRGYLPIVVGGTGFYLRALLDGLAPAPPRHEALRQRLQQMETRRPRALLRVLRRLDPEAAARIHANDTPKLIRAIEISALSGVSASKALAVPREPFTGIRTFKLGLSPQRSSLYALLNERTRRLFENGLIAETERLLATGYTVDSRPMQSLGYKQAVQYLKGESSIEQAIQDCQTKTRQYAKRQMTWFRAERDVQWLEGFGTDEEVQQTASKSVLDWL